MEVIIAHEKHGTFTYSSALGLLKKRVEDGYWYDNWDEGGPRHQWEDRAKAIVNGTIKLKEGVEPTPEIFERIAWRFLLERKDYEYESVEKQTVQ